jgi:hypothetical protein
MHLNPLLLCDERLMDSIRLCPGYPSTVPSLPLRHNVVMVPPMLVARIDPAAPGT